MLLPILLFWFTLTSTNLLPLSLAAHDQIIDDVPCGIGASACTCDKSADVCQFSLEISLLYTFTRYTINDNNVRQNTGQIYNINNTGKLVRLGSKDLCNGTLCTEAQTVDGKTFREFIAVNSRIPGPTLIVHEDQTVVVNVKNNLTDEDISVHWHGMFQFNTPWMDGVALITQCPIGIGNTFRYIFKASPTGTFWYHSHSNAQRSDGLFGGLIIMENNIVRDYEDLPEQHTITLLDWHTQSSLEVFDQLHSDVGFYEGISPGELPTNSTEKYKGTCGPDGTGVGPVPYESGLINGRGRHPDVQYNNAFLSIFEVEQGRKYRFRLIGSEAVFGYRFSIDGHRLSLIAADGFLVEPKPVDFIIVYAGERYDFVLEANQSNGNYWIRAETLEVDLTGSPPYKSLNHTAEAILHYNSSTPPPTPTEYASISSTPRVCSQSNQCVAVNCPFEKYHVSYNIRCINVHELRLLEPTPENELPAAVPDSGQEYFFNFGFDGPNNQSSINARVFDLPPFPLQTQGENLTGSDHTFCPPQGAPDACENGCSMCVNMHHLPFNNTIRFVLSSVSLSASHPIHLHGHSFQVLGIGYGSYSDMNGKLIEANSSVSCNGNQRCPSPSWTNNSEPMFPIDPKTIRKDTIIVPAGGFVVLHFISNNPGYWFMHCHIEVHQLEGMAQVINEALGHQNPPPDGFQTCGDFNLTIEEFNRKINFTPVPVTPTTAAVASSTEPNKFCSCLDEAELVITVVFVTLGFILTVAGSVAIGMVICYVFCKKKGCFTPKNPTKAPTQQPRQQPTEQYEMTPTA